MVLLGVSAWSGVEDFLVLRAFILSFFLPLGISLRLRCIALHCVALPCLLYEGLCALASPPP